MNRFLTSTSTLLLIFIRNFLLLAVVLLALDNFTSIDVSFYVGEGFLPMLTCLLVVVYGVLWLHKKNWKNKIKEHKNFQFFQNASQIILLSGLGLIIIGYLLGDYEFFKYIKWLYAFNQYPLLLLTLASGVFVFWVNGEELSRKEEEFQLAESDAEIKRASEFSKKFPRLNRVPLLRNIIKWMYKEGWWYVIILVTLLIGGFVLRMWNLTILDPYTDEYNHLLAAKGYLETGSFTYSRAKLVTYSVALFYWIGNASSFYEYLFWGRVPGVIFGTLTGIPLYFLAKQISKNIGITTVLLWMISPWAIGVARTVREYAFYPLVILFVVLSFVKLIEYLLEFKREDLKKITLLVTILIGFLYYAYKIDNLSTLKLSFLIFPAIMAYFAIFRIKTILAMVKRNKVLFFSSLGATLLILLALFWLGINSDQLSFIDIKMDKRWINAVINTRSIPIQTSDVIKYKHIIYLLLSLGTSYALFNKRKKYFLHSFIFIIILIFFMYFFDRYFRPRYIFYSLPFFIILISTSIYAVFICIRQFFSAKIFQKIALLISILFFLGISNFENTIYPAISSKHGYVFPTYEYHDRILEASNFLTEILTEDDVIITTMSTAFQFVLNLDSTRFDSYNYKDKDRFKKVKEILNIQSQGFLVLDTRRNGKWASGYPKSGTFLIGNKEVIMIKKINSFNIYRWENLN